MQKTDVSNVSELNSNAGWCWFQDPRVIVDRESGDVVFATVANASGANGATRDADIDITSYHLLDGTAKTVAIANIPTQGLGDDHNAAALWQRPDGRYLAVYTGHNLGMYGDDESPDMFYRVSRHPNDAFEWSEEKKMTWPDNDPVGEGNCGATYSNLHFLTEEGERGRLYNFSRTAGQVWQIATSDNWGETWEYRGILSLPPKGGRAYSNGYVKFSSDGLRRIDFIITEAHPRDYNNGLYHGYIQGGKSYNAEGQVVDPDTFSLKAPGPEEFTPIFLPQEIGLQTTHTAWAVELSRTTAGELKALFITRHGRDVGPLHVTRPLPGTADHRLHLAELQSGTWQSYELAKMGAGLLDTEEDYTGLGVIDRRTGATIYISTPIDPRNGTLLPNHEIFCATVGTGAGWPVCSWDKVTGGLEKDSLRPQLAFLNDGKALLLWLSGTYRHQTDYDTKVLVQVIE